MTFVSAQVGALEDEERAKGDQEARDPRLHHQIPVEEPDGQRDDQREEASDPQVEVVLVREHRGEQPGRGDHDAGREVELAADHQHADSNGDDPDGRALVEDRRQGLGRPERRCHDQEEDSDDDGGHEGTDLGSCQGSAEEPDLHPVRLLGRGFLYVLLFLRLTHENLRGSVGAGGRSSRSAGRPSRGLSVCPSGRTEG